MGVEGEGGCGIGYPVGLIILGCVSICDCVGNVHVVETLGERQKRLRERERETRRKTNDRESSLATQRGVMTGTE